MSSPVARSTRVMLVLVFVGLLLLVLLLGVLSWWLLPRLAPTQVIRYSPFPALIVRAVSEGDAHDESAITALQALHAEPAMVAFADSTREVERGVALRVLGKSKDHQYFVQVANGLHDSAVAVRIEAAHALGDLGDPRAIPLLIECLTSRERADIETVASAAAHALERLPATQVADAVEPLLERDIVFPLVLGRNTDPRVPHWLDRLVRKPGMTLEEVATTQMPPLSIAAAMALARNPQMDATRLYLLALRDESREVRGRAVIGLRRIGGARVRAELQTAVLDLLRDPDLQVLTQVVKYCSWKSLKDALPGIYALLTDPDPQRRLIAINAYRWDFHEPEATKELLRLAQDTDDRLRAAAVSALGRIPRDTDPAITTALLTALRDPARVVRCAGINSFFIGTQDATIIAALMDLLVRSQDPLDQQLVTALITTLANQKLTPAQQGVVEDAKRRVSYIVPPVTQVVPPPCMLTQP